MRRAQLSAVLLGAICLVWAAVPVRWPWVLAVAIAAVTFSALRLLLGRLPRPANEFLLTAPMRLWLRLHDAMHVPPWEEIATGAIVWLEALHRSRPWHTAVLGALLVAYLLAVHLTESGAPVATLRPWARVLFLGVCLLVVCAAIGMLSPAVGSPGALLRVAAAIAAAIAAGLILPASSPD